MTGSNYNRLILFISISNVIFLLAGILYFRSEAQESRAGQAETKRILEIVLKGQRGMVLASAGGDSTSGDPAQVEDSFRRVLAELLQKERATAQAALKVTRTSGTQDSNASASRPRVDPEEQRQAMTKAEELLSRAMDDGIWSEKDSMYMQIHNLKLSNKQRGEIRRRFFTALNQGKFKATGPGAVIF